VRGAGAELAALLEATGALYLDSGECKGVLPDDHPSLVTAMRGTVMGDADLVVTIGRKLDFQLGYGSPAVFGAARWLRIADCAAELCDNRRGDVELFATPRLALQALRAAGRGRAGAVDAAWRERVRAGHVERAARLRESMAGARDGSDGFMHPNRLLAEVQHAIGDDAVVVADGGDFLSFARVGMRCATYLDPGSLGCIGVGTGFGIGAALAAPGRTVAVLTGDGAFGFNAMEIDTAVRHRVPVLIVVANNGAWQIEVHDQTTTHGKVVGTRLQHADYAAMARAFGAHGERVHSASALPAALDRALQALRGGRPALLDVLVSGEPMSSDARTGLAWVPDLQPLAAWDDAERRWRAGTVG
ncbi:MAG: thiamine pyrophosphate-binding protein, partial [Burkholderiales bacterium]|nr:thiamine pyrophosphate-binding protein [Burkholderiales bacterium]